MTYAHARLARALRTASTHPDAAARERAGSRAGRWQEHLRGVATGDVTVGSRTPTTFPDWVTLEVLRGGFATGEAVAAGPLAADEVALAADLAVPADRASVLAGLLTGAGLARLGTMLDDGDYTLTCPEEAVTLVVAWLVRAGDVDAAVRLVAEVAPWSSTLRLWPARAAATDADGRVHRRTVADTQAALRRRAPSRAVEAQREALTVWAPFADRLLALWWATVVDGAVDAERPQGWSGACLAAAAEHADLSGRHRLCTTHTDPKENLGVLVEATQAASAGELDPDLRRRLQRAVDAMVRARGVPGSDELALVRASALAAVTPSHAAVAHVVAARLDALPAWTGVPDAAAVLGPVDESEASTAAPAGTCPPAAVRRAVALARSAPLDTLVADGVVGSAEVLAEIAPQLAGPAWARRYADPTLRTLMGRVYEAFRSRRSVLLTDLAAQVRVDELPWVRAVSRHAGAGEHSASADALHALGALYLDHFPGQVLPNALVTELTALAGPSTGDAVFLPELAADIFTGTFSPRFAVVATTASTVLHGTAYDVYYGLTTAAREMSERSAARAATAGDPDRGPEQPPARTVTPRSGRAADAAFAEVCWDRARAATGRGPEADPEDWTVALDGAVIEQAQVLTTHGLVTLVGLGIQPGRGWKATSRRAFGVVRAALTAAWAYQESADPEVRHQGLRAIKNAAYAWRQTVFFVSMLDGADARRVVDVLAASATPVHGRLAVSPTAQEGTSEALARLVADLRAALDGTAPERAFLGWVVGADG